MKNNFLLLLFFAAITFVSCRSSSSYRYNSPDFGGFEADYDNDAVTDYVSLSDKSSHDFNAYRSNAYRSKGDQGLISVPKAKKKIIASAVINVDVKDQDTTMSILKKIAEKYEGYAVEISTSRNVIRVKSEHFNAALKEVYGLGYVSRKSITGQDKTAEYLDLKIRLENAEKARKRYLELLAKAENVEAALKVEKELERLNGTIDRLKGRMGNINHLTAYSTITVYQSEKVKPGVLGYIGIGVYRGVKWLFVRN